MSSITYSYDIWQGAEVDSAGPEGKTPLHYAVQKASLDTIRLLIDKGAKPKHADECGRTILHYVVDNEKLECLELLMELLPKVSLESMTEPVKIRIFLNVNMVHIIRIVGISY